MDSGSEAGMTKVFQISQEMMLQFWRLSHVGKHPTLAFSFL
jgi:hypothetical protein